MPNFNELNLAKELIRFPSVTPRDVGAINFLSKKLKADEEFDTKDNKNFRQYGVGAQILSDLGVKKMILLSNSKKKAIGLKGFDLSIVDWERLD